MASASNISGLLRSVGAFLGFSQDQDEAIDDTIPDTPDVRIPAFRETTLDAEEETYDFKVQNPRSLDYAPISTAAQRVFGGEGFHPLPLILDFVTPRDLARCRRVNKACDHHIGGRPPTALERVFEYSGRVAANGHVSGILNLLSTRDLARCTRVNKGFKNFKSNVRAHQREKILASLSLRAFNQSLRALLGEESARSAPILNLAQPRPLSDRSRVSQVVGITDIRRSILDFLPVIDQYSCKGVSHSFLHDVESVQERRVSKELSPALVKRYGRELFKEARIAEACMFLPTSFGGNPGEYEQTQHVSFERGRFTVVIHAKIFYPKMSSFAICLFQLQSLKRNSRDLLV